MKLNSFYETKTLIFVNTWSEKVFQGIVVNRALPSLHAITRIVPLTKVVVFFGRVGGTCTVIIINIMSFISYVRVFTLINLPHHQYSGNHRFRKTWNAKNMFVLQQQTESNRILDKKLIKFFQGFVWE